MDATTFVGRTDNNRYLAEAVVAAYGDDLRQGLTGSDWRVGGSRRQPADVTWWEHVVHVKSCFLQDVYGPSGKGCHLGFACSARSVEVRPGVTHYGLVYFPEGASVHVAIDGRVTIESSLPTVFLVPAADVERFYRRYYVDGSGPSKCHARYLPVEQVETWRVFGPPLPVSSIESRCRNYA